MSTSSMPENMNALFNNLEKFLHAKTVFGEPITAQGVTLVPVVDISFGAGAGGGSSEKPAASDGFGGGAGGRVTASAIIVIRGEHVQVMQIKKSTNLDRLMDMLPELLDRLSSNKKDSSAVENVVKSAHD